MKPPPFEYFRPDTVEDAIRLLTENENAKVLAGGQSLMPMLNLRYIFPDTIVDINGLQDLAGIEADTKRVRIGAMTRQRKIEYNPQIMALAPIFPQALKLVGHRQTRNRGTIGGSLCHLDPASELPTLALLYDATVEVAGAPGRRMIPIASFIAGFMMPNIEPNEIVSAVELTPWPPGHGYSFHEFARRHGDFAIASAACLVELDGAGRVRRCAIAIGGIGSVPQRHPVGEESFTGSDGGPEAIEQAVALCSHLEALGDFHGGPEFRHSAARTMLRRSLVQAIERARSGGTAS